ncbi:MAG: sulfatase family protein [Oceanipulchritudo sp.]
MSDQNPNVIWILCDQLRAQAFSYRGDANLHTPNIDNLAREGMRFDCAIAGTPWCTPFRGALITGQYPHQVGTIRTPSPLDPKYPTIANAFTRSGYHTAWIGKWHLHGSNGRVVIPPTHRGGFEYWLGYENNNSQNDSWVHGSGHEEPMRLPGYETDSLTDLFLDHLQAHVRPKETGNGYKPFFACLSVQPPHNPYVPPTNPSYPDTGPSPNDIQFRPNVPHADWVRERVALDLAGYYAMIRNLDWNLGRIRKALKDMGIDRETYIIFFSDHGDMLGSHGQREKSSPWEEAVRIPFIVAKTGGVESMRAGRTSAVINHVDIAPTTLGLCGIPKPKDMVGFDYSANCLREEDHGYKGEPVEAEEPDSAYLQQIPRKHHPHSVNKQWRAVVMRDGWKYVCTPGNDWLLHNTREDPYEMANLAHDTFFKEQRRRCRDRLQRWIEETGDEFPLPEE